MQEVTAEAEEFLKSANAAETDDACDDKCDFECGHCLMDLDLGQLLILDRNEERAKPMSS